MKKIVQLFLFFALCSFNVCSAGAADDYLARNAKQHIGIVLIGSNEYLSEAYYEIASEIVPNADGRASVKVGGDLQEAFGAFRRTPKTTVQANEQNTAATSTRTPHEGLGVVDLVEFAKQSGLDQLICLNIKSPVIEQYEGTGLLGPIDKTRAIVQINAFLCDAQKLVDSCGAVCSSKATKTIFSGNISVQATKGAFEKCCEDIRKNFFEPESKVAKEKSIPAPSQNIGVVIVGDAEFKVKGYYTRVQNELLPKDNKNYTVQAGNNVQDKYVKYWAEKGYLDEQPLNDENMKDFAAVSGFDKVVYIITDMSSSYTSDLGTLGAFLFGETKETSVQGTMVAFLCDKNGIINKSMFSAENTQMGHDQRQVKENVFKKGIKNLAKEWADAF